MGGTAIALKELKRTSQSVCESGTHRNKSVLDDSQFVLPAMQHVKTKASLVPVLECQSRGRYTCAANKPHTQVYNDPYWLVLDRNLAWHGTPNSETHDKL